MKTVVLVSMLMVFSAAASSQEKERPSRVWTSGDDLVAQCSQVLDQFATGACMGYVVAAAEIADSGHLKGYRSCIPKDVSKGQLQDVVKRYLAKHQEQLQYIGYQVVVVALVDAFPCPQSQ